MRYCRLSPGLGTASETRQDARSGTFYARVEERDGVLWAVAAIDPPQEDPAARAAAPVEFEPTPLSALHLLPAVTPSKILCVGRNYRDHAAELGNEVPREPLLFLKPPSSLLGSGGIVRLPNLSKRVDYEGELGLVIGKRCRTIGPDEDVRKYIRGYVCVNDVTARDLQKSDGQWTRGKGFDTFCPVGPIVSDEIDPISAPVTVTTHVNDELRQTGSTADFIFGIPELLRYITAFATLEPGDLIPTGTPAGVGPLAPGDRVRVTINGLGVLENTFQSD